MSEGVRGERGGGKGATKKVRQILSQVWEWFTHVRGEEWGKREG